MKRILILLLSIAFPVTAAEPPTVWQRVEAGEFVVFAAIIGTALPDDCPVEPITYLDGGFFRPGPDGEPVDLEYLAKGVKKVQSRNGIVAIDLEDSRVLGLTSWSDDQEEWKRHGTLAKQVIETIREVQPEWKLGWFGRLPNTEVRHVNGYHAHQGLLLQGSRHREWLRVSRLYDFHKSRSDLLDWYHPCHYMTEWHWIYAHEQNAGMRWQFDNQGTTSPVLEAQLSPLDVWQDTVQASTRLIRAQLSDKPLIPAISPQWWSSTARSRPAYGQHFSREWLQEQLDTIRLHCDGVVLWCHPGADGWTPEAFLESDRWRIICDWARTEARVKTGE